MILLLCAASSSYGSSETAAPSDTPLLVDVTAESGIQFLHVNGIEKEKNYIPETKGGGAGFFDFDNDGYLDLLLVQGSTIDRHKNGESPRCALYRNRGDGTFEDVSDRSGLNHRGWGMGVTFGDIENDGYTAIYITYLGPNRLYRNNGDGTFVDVTKRAGVGDSNWSTSSAFGDYDGDGDLDLYVANYLFVNFDALPPKACRHRDTIVLCGPMGLTAVRDVLYRNNGDGTFTDVSEESGVLRSGPYYGLGVAWGDLDNDRDLDLYVANDATPNFLFVNQGDGTFEELGLLSGLAVNAEGREQSSMGVDIADYDNDGWLDLYMTHFSDDYSTLYHNDKNLSFRDVTAQAKLLSPEINLVSWGTRFVDFNLDGWKDIFHSNGHVYPYLIRAGLNETFEEPESLYINLGDGTFRNAGTEAGEGIQTPRVGRGVAFGDYDNDGDIDLLIVNLNASPTLLRTDRRDQHNWIMFRTVGRKSNYEGIGTRIQVNTGEMRQFWEVKRAGSIYSASDPRAHFGLGDSQVIDSVKVAWPSGTVQEFLNVVGNQHYIVDEREGLKREFGQPEVSLGSVED